MSDRALRAGAPRANRQRQRLVCACACAGGGGAFLQHWPPELGGELGSDAGPSRDRELQSDAAFGAVVTPVWVPAPRCPAHGGLASGPGSGAGKRPGARRGQRGSGRPTLLVVRGSGTKRAQVLGAFAPDSPELPSPCLRLCRALTGRMLEGRVSRGKYRDCISL